MHSKVRNIPRNTQLRGRLFDKWPRKGLSGACCGPSGEVSGAPTGRGPACSAARDGDGLGVLRWSRGGTSAFSGAGQGGAGGSAVEPGGGASVFSGAGRGGTGSSEVQTGRGQRVQRWGPVRDGGGTGGGSAAQAGAGPACSAARDRGGTGSSEVQTGRAGRREGGGGHGQSTAAPPPPKGRCGVQSRRPRRRVAKKVFRGEGAPPPEHIRAQKKRTSVRSLLFLLLCYSTGFCSGMLVRYTLPHDNGSALREPVSFAGDFRQHVLLQQPVCLRFRSARRSGVTAVKASAIRSLSRSAARRSGLSRLAAGISAVRVAPVKAAAARVVPVKAAAHRPGPSSQPPGVTVLSRHPVPSLSRPGSRPSAARNLPSLLLAPSAAGVTAPPRQYGRPPATGEFPASSLRRASPARDSTAYRPAP